jgi:protoheme IX farnesyltransferase
MQRTQYRPLVQNVMKQSQALLFALALFIFGSGFLISFSNYQTLFLTSVASCGYGFLYTLYLKYATPQNIVIGGLYGAFPPLLGWVALTDRIDPQAWLLVLLIYVWTPPHFWALAIERVNEYKEAGIPMLPVTHGEKFTAFLMLCYTALLLPVCWMLILSGLGSYFFLAVSSFLTIWYFLINLKIYRGSYDVCKKSFLFSIWYLYALFFTLLLEKFLGVF